MMERRQGPWWGSKPDGSHAPGERPGKGKSEGLNGNDARRLAIRPGWFSVVLAPEREQSGQSGQGEQADDDKVGSEAGTALGDPAGNRHESGREQVAQSAETPDHQTRVARGDVLTESKIHPHALYWAFRRPLRICLRCHSGDLLQGRS